MLPAKDYFLGFHFTYMQDKKAWRPVSRPRNKKGVSRLPSFDDYQSFQLQVPQVSEIMS